MARRRARPCDTQVDGISCIKPERLHMVSCALDPAAGGASFAQGGIQAQSRIAGEGSQRQPTFAGQGSQHQSRVAGDGSQLQSMFAGDGASRQDTELCTFASRWNEEKSSAVLESDALIGSFAHSSGIVSCKKEGGVGRKGVEVSSYEICKGDGIGSDQGWDQFRCPSGGSLPRHCREQVEATGVPEGPRGTTGEGADVVGAGVGGNCGEAKGVREACGKENGGDRALGDRAVGDRVVGDRAVGDRASGDSAVGDSAVGDSAVGDSAVGTGLPITALSPDRSTWDLRLRKRIKKSSLDVPLDGRPKVLPGEDRRISASESKVSNGLETDEFGGSVIGRESGMAEVPESNGCKAVGRQLKPRGRTPRLKTSRPLSGSISSDTISSDTISAVQLSSPVLRGPFCHTVPRGVSCSNILPQQFFCQDAVALAPLLLGKLLQRDQVVLRITEVEAYREGDTACHARFGRTARTAPLFGLGGHAYVYLCYGLHQMLNITADREGHGAACLVRACEPVSGEEMILSRRNMDEMKPGALAGPGRVGAALGLDTQWSGHSLYSKGGLMLLDAPLCQDILVGPRVGIEYAQEEDRFAQWRFALAGSPWVSAPRKSLTRPR